MTPGHEVCVQFILDLAARVEQHGERLARLEAQLRQDSRSSSRPPSADPPRSRAERRAAARAKAKELMRRDGVQRQAGGQSGHEGVGANSGRRTRSMKSSITIRTRAVVRPGVHCSAVHPGWAVRSPPDR